MIPTELMLYEKSMGVVNSFIVLVILYILNI